MKYVVNAMPIPYEKYNFIFINIISLYSLGALLFTADNYPTNCWNVQKSNIYGFGNS